MQSWQQYKMNRWLSILLCVVYYVIYFVSRDFFPPKIRNNSREKHFNKFQNSRASLNGLQYHICETHLKLVRES